nr:hypothetical protein [Tanacetum cinerariifolium]
RDALIGKRLSIDLTFPIGFDCEAKKSNQCSFRVQPKDPILLQLELLMVVCKCSSWFMDEVTWLGGKFISVELRHLQEI